MSLEKSGNTARIAANSFWLGLEMAFDIVSGLVTTFILARTFGPERLGYFNYVMWLTTLSGAIGSLGLPLTCRKYMAEFLGQGRPEMARAIFEYSFRRHALLSVLVTLFGVTMVFTLSDPLWRTVSLLQVLSVLPGMLRHVPSQANMAAENLKANVPGSIIGQSCHVGGVLLCIALGWDLAGIAASMFAARAIELAVRTIPVLRWIKRLPAASLPPEQAIRFKRFAQDSILTQLVQLVVWDRSDMIFLERLASSRAEISFFSVAFNLTDRALLLPTTLAHSTSVAMLVQYGRQPASLPPMAAQTIKYVLVMATPLLWGLASLSSILVPLLYGPAFTPAAVCLALSASIAVFRSLLPPGVNYLQAVERQRFLFVWNLVCAVVNVALDVLLIPRYQALGAVSANGVAQFMAIAGIWSMVFRTGRIPVPWKAVASILGAGAAMAAGVWALVRTLPPLLAVGVSIPAGAAIYLGILRLLGVFDQRDAERLRQIEQKLPARLRPLWSFAVQIAVVRRTADIGSIPGGENSR